MSEILPNDGPRPMRCWIVKTDDKEYGAVKVVSCEYARYEDEVYMFCDNANRVFRPRHGFRKTHGIFVQLRKHENYNGPFKSRKIASDWARRQLNG